MSIKIEINRANDEIHKATRDVQFFQQGRNLFMLGSYLEPKEGFLKNLIFSVKLTDVNLDTME